MFFLSFTCWKIGQYVAATQPINALAFVFDGVNYGASDFTYSAYSMVSLENCFFCRLNASIWDCVHNSWKMVNLWLCHWKQGGKKPQPLIFLLWISLFLPHGICTFCYSQIMVALVSILSLYALSSSLGFTGIWIALLIYMTLRIFAGFWR